MILCEILFEKDKGVKKISLVKSPAISVDFLKLAKEKELKFNINEDKQLVVGPVLVPNRQYYRNKDYFGGEEAGYVFFKEDTVRNLGIDFLKNGENFNLEHKEDVAKDDIDLVESWFIESENDKAYSLGFSKEDCPIGTWMASHKVNNPELWQKIKAGEFNGYSIQGYLAKNVIAEGLALQKEYTEDEIVGIVVGLCLAEVSEPPVIAEDNATHQIDKTFLYNWNDGSEDVIVNSVNGDAVRNSGFDQWVDGGNHYVDSDLPAAKQLYAKFIPEPEIWVDDVFTVKPDDEQAIVLHEMLERSLIKDYGFKYSNDVDGAHEIANAAEVQLRNQANGQKNDELRQSIYTDFLKKYGADKQKFTASGLSGKTTTHKLQPNSGGTVTTTGIVASSGATTPSGTTTGTTSGATPTLSGATTGATTGTTGQTGTTAIKMSYVSPRQTIINRRLNMGVNKSVTTSEDNQNIPTTVSKAKKQALIRQNETAIIPENNLMKAMLTWKTPEERKIAMIKWQTMRNKQESVQLSEETSMGAPDNFPNTDHYGALSGGRVGGSAQRDRTLKTIDKKKQIKQQADAMAKQRAFDEAKAEATKKDIIAKQKALKQDKSKPTAVQTFDLPGQIKMGAPEGNDNAAKGHQGVLANLKERLFGNKGDKLAGVAQIDADRAWKEKNPKPERPSKSDLEKNPSLKAKYNNDVKVYNSARAEHDRAWNAANPGTHSSEYGKRYGASYGSRKGA